MEPSYSVVADWLSKFHTWPAFIQMLWLVVPSVTLLGTTWLVMRGLRDIAAVLGGWGEATLHGVRAEWNGPPLSHRGGMLRSAGGGAREGDSFPRGAPVRRRGATMWIPGPVPSVTPHGLLR